MQGFDGAGTISVPSYDFKGLPLASNMKLFEDATISDANWDALNYTDLSIEVFTTSITTDALSRPKVQADPGNNNSENTYGRYGALKTVIVNGDTYVQNILHNAKGQRDAIWYGNGTKTSYSYDDLSQRLKRLLTVNLNTNDILQDLNYWYDAVGNITTIRDDAQQALFFDNTIVNPDLSYTYDALYRLIAAQGREQIGLATFGPIDNYNDSAWQTSHKGDATATQRYIQKYSYDKVGNMLELQHLGGSGSYTRTYTIDGGSNSLERTQVGGQVYDYTHETRGNMVTMPHLSAMDYDLQNQMHHVTAATVDAYYQYSGGQRVRKYVDKGGGLTEERVYFGGFELYRKYLSGTIDVERSTVHVQDDTGRIAMLEVRNTSYNSDGSADFLKRYIYGNHLGSAALELDDAGDIISYEEYHPYGTTAYQAMNASINAVAKRYRFTGKERDEETGLNYHCARYYALWLCRWCAVDPLLSDWYNAINGEIKTNARSNFLEISASSYEYCYDNPINYLDQDGKQPLLYQLPEQYVVAQKQNKVVASQKQNKVVKNFFKGLLIGAAIAVAVVAVVATGGAALAVIAPAAATALATSATVATLGAFATGIGGGLLVANTIQSARGRDLLNNKISSEQAAFNMGFGLGGALVAPAAKPISKAITKAFSKTIRPNNISLPETAPAEGSLTPNQVENLVEVEGIGGTSRIEKQVSISYEQSPSNNLSPKVQEVINKIEKFKAEGGSVQPNPLQDYQELNLSFTENGKPRLDLRIETHDLAPKFGGTGDGNPIRHMNVDWHPHKSRLPNGGHVILQQ